MAERADWMSDAEVTLLNGDPIPQSMEFPIDPPAEIGKVRAVYSTCVVGQPLRSGCKRWAMVFLVGVFIALPFPFLTGMGNNVGTWIAGCVVGALFALASMPFVLYFTRGKDWVAYIGEIGLVRYVLGSKREVVKRTELFEFADAADLFTHTVNHSVNLVYAGTSYRYMWRDADNKQVFLLSGRHNSKQGTPKAHSPYYLATAAEMMWTAFLSDAINIELKEQGAVHFKVNKKDWVRVGPGFMEFHFKGKTAKLAVEEIKDLRVGGGHFTIRSQDAGWLGGKGRYGFEYGKMANARLFLMCLEQLCGYSFG